MANIPGISGYVTPNVFSRVRTIRRSASIPGGLRTLAIVGLGRSEETIVLNALGQGADGLNPTFTGTAGSDGRHFQLAKANLVAKRTDIYKNGIPLDGTEATISTAAFDSKYDYRLEPSTGRIELQRAHLVDQGGSYAPAGASNVGDGALVVSLEDVNAPQETWTIRATSVIRDGYGDPISGNAVFAAVGSVSGQVSDGYGQPVFFVSDGVAKSNGIISVTITEGSTAFERGDRFSVKISSGVLKAGDTLEARYIANADVGDPEFFVDSAALYEKHGYPSEENTLSLGASIAFENGAFGVLAVQAKPPISRRTSEILILADDPLTVETEGIPTLVGAPAIADIDVFKYTILGGTPSADTAVNIFVTDGNTQGESQILPTKFPFYDANVTSDPWNNFINVENYSYTVILSSQIDAEGNDGEVVVGESTFVASSGSFTAADIGKSIRLLPFDKFGAAFAESGTYVIAGVGDGSGDDTIVTLTGITWAGTADDLRWELVDSTKESPRILFTKDLYGGAFKGGDGLRISFIDVDDASFYDSHWGEALEALQLVEAQMVVPLPNCCYSAIQQAVVAHCELMSTTANQKERFALIGAPMGVTSEALLGRELVAVENIGILEGIQGDDPEEVLAGNIEDLQDYSVEDNWGGTFRAAYFWPDEIIRVISGTATSLHGFYMAAAAGGLLAGTADVSLPLTRKNLTGFSILREKLRRPIILNALGQAGVCVVQPVTGGGQILHGKTTIAGGDATEEEISVIFIRDAVARGLRGVLRGFIGKAEDPTLAASITSNVVKAMMAFESQNLISDYRNIRVARDEVEPRQWNVSVEAQPTLPANWVFVDVSVGMF